MGLKITMMMTFLNLLLAVILAIATVFQAIVLWTERRTPLQNAVFEKKALAVIEAAEAIEEECRLRFDPSSAPNAKSTKELAKAQEQWISMMTKRRQAQLTLELVGDKETLAALQTVYERQDVFDGKKSIENESQAVRSSFGDQNLIFWNCNQISKDFISSARKVSGLDELSEAMLKKFSASNSLDSSRVPSKQDQ
jgi:hypothetical protein